jgi:3-oxoacyl-[acyl-carrier protein] reductase
MTCRGESGTRQVTAIACAWFTWPSGAESSRCCRSWEMLISAGTVDARCASAFIRADGDRSSGTATPKTPARANQRTALRRCDIACPLDSNGLAPRYPCRSVAGAGDGIADVPSDILSAVDAGTNRGVQVKRKRVPMALRGKIAIVTGASAGIGRAYALALAGAGATVIGVARTLGRRVGEPERNTLEEVVQAGDALPGQIHARVCDVELESDITRLVGETAADFGRVDVLVNNAGLMTTYEPLGIAGADWDRMMRINVRAPYLAIREAAPHMIRQRSGSVVNVTARAAGFTPKGDRASDGTLVYAVSKAALNRLTYFMAEELKPHGIAVNALSPGIVATDTVVAAHPEVARSAVAKRPTPEVLGPALLHLARQTADGLTGQILHTDEFGTGWP